MDPVAPGFDESSLTENDKAMLEINPIENSELSVSPEQVVTLDAKRELLANGGEFAFRFVNSKEYFDLLSDQKTTRNLETVTEDIRKIVNSKFGSVHDKSSPAKSLIYWWSIADKRTNWSVPSSAISASQVALSEYKKLWRKAKDDGKSATEARAEFADLLKAKVKRYMVSATEAHDLSEATKLLTEEHRAKLGMLLEKDSADYTRSDLRFLIRYAKDGNFFSPIKEASPDSRTGNSGIPYEFLEIWSVSEADDKLNPWNDAMGFTSLPKGTELRHLMGVVLLNASDKELTQELADKILSSSRDNPENAHLIIDANFYESFPNRRNDILAGPNPV